MTSNSQLPAQPSVPEDTEAAQAASQPVAAATPDAESPEAGSTAPAAAAAAPQAPAPVDPAACARQLKERFPGLFGGAPKPLKLRIQADIQARAPGVFTKASLSAFLRRHTGSTSYLIALSRASHRYDLDGQPTDALTDEHRQVALEELARRRNLQAERRAQEDAERRARAGLLRDFERTTLTLANFCALKGVAPEALDGLLALARKEAAEGPPPDARPFGRPGGDRGRRDGPRGDGGPRPDGRRGGPGGERRHDDRPRGAGPARPPRGEGGSPDRRHDGGRGRPGGGGHAPRTDRPAVAPQPAPGPVGTSAQTDAGTAAAAAAPAVARTDAPSSES